MTFYMKALTLKTKKPFEESSKCDYFKLCIILIPHGNQL